MPPLSAIDAIQPAWIHTRLLLWGRRDKLLLFKLAAVAFFAEVGSGFSSSVRAPGRLGHNLPASMHAALLPMIVGLVCISALIGLVMLYVSSRLQFVLFDIVLRGETQVAPVWRRFGPATWRWIGLKGLLYAAILLCLLPVALPTLLLVVHSIPKGAGAALGALLAGMVGFVAAMLLIVFVAAIACILLRDFGLPSMALEGTPLRETVRRVVALARAEPGPTALYLLMRFVLGLAGALVSYLVLLALGVVAALPLGGAAFALWGALRGGSPTSHVLMVAGWSALALLLAALLLPAAILLFGYAFTFLQAYAILYLAGRYPLLASQWVALAPAPVAAPPFAPSFVPPAAYSGWAGPPPPAS